MKISAIRLAVLGLIACAQTNMTFAVESGTNYAATPTTEATSLQPVVVSEAAQRSAYWLSGSGSATRTETPLQELPQSVQVVSRGFMDDIQATRLDNVLLYVSGVARQNDFGGLWDNYSIRGFSGQENGGWNLLWNGFASNRGYSSPRDVANVERIDFMKGPAAALYGSSEPGGTINMVTKKPLFKVENSLDLSVGTNDVYRTAVDSTGPLSENVAYRLNVAVERKGSMRDYVHSQRELFAPALTWRISPVTVLDYEAEILRHRIPLDRGLPRVQGRLDALPASRFLGEPGDGNTNVQNQNHQLILTHQFYERWHLRAGVFHKQGRMDGYGTEIMDVPNLQGNVSRRRRYRDFSWHDTSLQVEMGGKFFTAGVQHEILMGVEADRLSLDQGILSSRATPVAPFALNVYQPAYGQTAPGIPLVFSQAERQNSIGVFFQDQLSLSERWKLLAGIRVDSFRDSVTNRRNGRNTSQSQSASSPRLGLTYLLSPSISFYASASKSFRPNTGADVAGKPFSPERARAVEAGMKYERNDKNLGASVAVFDIVKNNVLTVNASDPDFYVAAGEVRSRGIELDVNGTLNKHWRLTGNFAYTDAVVTRDNALSVGTRLVNVPRLSGSALVIYEDVDSRGERYGVGGGLNYVGVRTGDTAGSFNLPSYVAAKALAYWQVTPTMRFSLNIDNLFNKRYYATSYDQRWIVPGAERSATLGLNLKF